MKSNHSYNFYQPSPEELKDQHIHQLMNSSLKGRFHPQITLEILNHCPKSSINQKNHRYKDKIPQQINSVKQSKEKKLKPKPQIKLPSFPKRTIPEKPIAKPEQRNAYLSDRENKKQKKKPNPSTKAKHQDLSQLLKRTKKEMQQLLKPVHYIPKPMAYVRNKPAQVSLNQGEDSSEDSQEAEVPMSFYQRQYQEMLKQQCRQELNFLYWSQNTDTKEWVGELLKVLSKHDDEVDDLHKKMKMMEKFDEAYFASLAYKK